MTLVTVWIVLLKHLSEKLQFLSGSWTTFQEVVQRQRYSRRMKPLRFLPLVTSLVSGMLVAPLGANEFTFARLAHASSDVSGWPRWQADWPHAEAHFGAGLARLTAIDVAGEGVVVDLRSDVVFDYPWIYAVEVGSLALSASEVSRLREFLLRGGFLLIDDFHGRVEWRGFAEAMRRVFPDRPIVDLDDGAEPFHVLYDLTEREQIPGIRPLMQGRTWEKGGRHPVWRGIIDDDGRVMVAINHNQDLGDAWEHADDVRYPEPLTAAAYRLGINYVIYAMTH